MGCVLFLLFINIAKRLFFRRIICLRSRRKFHSNGWHYIKNDGINCPDYSFYLAEHLITIDHQNQQATLKSFCFAQEEQVNIAKTSLSIAQKLKNIDHVLSIKSASDEVKTNFDDPEFTGIVKP